MSDPTPANPASRPPLGRAAPPPLPRGRRRVPKWWVLGLLLVAVGAGIVYGTAVWRRSRMQGLEDACMTATLPAGRAVFEENPAKARALDAAWPGEYKLDPLGRAVRTDARWAALSAGAELSAKVPAVPLPAHAPATAFCHERFAPGGHRRLVVIEEWWGRQEAVVVIPGEGRPPTVARREWMDRDSPTGLAIAMANSLTGAGYSMGAGAPDPADRSRFTVPFVVNGIAGTWAFRLEDDDRVTCELADVAGFKARVDAAGLREWAASTRPAAR